MCQNREIKSILTKRIVCVPVSSTPHGILNPLLWRHNGRRSVSNHQTHDCLLKHLFRRRSKKASKLRVTGLCTGNSPGTGEFPAQMVSNAENVSIWWRHHVYISESFFFGLWPPFVNNGLDSLKRRRLMPQSHHTPWLRTGCSRAVVNKNRTSTHAARTGPVRRRTNFASPYGARIQFYKCMHYKFTGPVRVWSSLTAPEQPVRSNTTPVRDFYKLRLCQFPHVSVRVPYGTLAGAARDRTGPVGIEKHYIFSYGARTTPARGPRGVLLIIRWNHKCAAVSNRTGPVVWCDHENSNILHF